MDKRKKWSLQMFAEGGAGAAELPMACFREALKGIFQEVMRLENGKEGA